MRSDTQKKISIIILTASAFVLNVVPWLPFMADSDTPLKCIQWTDRIFFVFRFQLWGWTVVMGLAWYAIKKVRGWELIPKSLKVIVIIFSLISIVLALLWCFILVLAYSIPA